LCFKSENKSLWNFLASKILLGITGVWTSSIVRYSRN
jgi:hypothetical protein